ncbi:MAG: hypothetical protein ACHQKY_16120, partial [Terriglobia bacterium]
KWLVGPMSVSDLFLVVNIAGITKNAMPAAPAQERDACGARTRTRSLQHPAIEIPAYLFGMVEWIES